MAAAAASGSMSCSNRRRLGGVVTVMVLLALVQLHSVAAVAGGKTYTVNWTYPYEHNFFSHWNEGTEYVVGDRITFLYNPKYHNVVRVTEEQYVGCHTKAIPHANGDTTYHLNRPGSYFFICTHLGHCAAGMKLSVRVKA